ARGGAERLVEGPGRDRLEVLQGRARRGAGCASPLEDRIDAGEEADEVGRDVGEAARAGGRLGGDGARAGADAAERRAEDDRAEDEPEDDERAARAEDLREDPAQALVAQGGEGAGECAAGPLEGAPERTAVDGRVEARVLRERR